MAFISSRLIPAARRGGVLEGLAHLADIYSTVVVGLAGLTLPADTGPVSSRNELRVKINSAFLRLKPSTLPAS